MGDPNRVRVCQKSIGLATSYKSSDVAVFCAHYIGCGSYIKGMGPYVNGMGFLYKWDGILI